MQPIGTHCGEVMYLGCVFLRGELGFLNCDDICMCVVNKQFEILEFDFDSVYVDLQYDAIDLTITPVSVSLHCACSRVVGFGCRGTLCGCGGCCDCAAYTVVYVACMFAEKL